MSEELNQAHCVPCEGGVQPLTEEQCDKLMPQVPGWRREGSKIHRTLEFEDFVALMDFVGPLAALAEQEAHHPDFCVHYNRLELTVWTHAIGGLSRNDYILAARINALLSD
ncbi:MAG: 4a-hydroxytetrahydrobiopterin dehydratase [Rickettsiales bacterium]|nr:4a-hydroxytetrahydrobiopterin dehydratase [Rickettsiales bacterium]|tara:strand:- start:458 stop:790 length:333 start_codon:yes stop_codon:yes gene_type:complete